MTTESISQQQPHGRVVKLFTAGQLNTVEKPKIINGKGLIVQTNFHILSDVYKSILLKHRDQNFELKGSHKNIETFEKFNNLDFDELARETVKYHNLLVENHGIEWGVKRYKTITGYAIQVLEGLTPPVPNCAIGKLDLFPTRLQHLRVLRTPRDDIYHPIGNQFIRSLLGVNRLVEDYKVLDLTTIVVKNKLDPRVEPEFKEFIKDRLAGFKGVGLKSYEVKPTTKVLRRGPNMAPKLETWKAESAALVRSPLFPHFETICKETGNEPYLNYVKFHADECEKSHASDDKNPKKAPLGKPSKKIKRQIANAKARALAKAKSTQKEPKVYIDSIESNIEKAAAAKIRKEISPNNAILRKITAIADVGNKSRVIAICDHNTQLLLTPFEDKINHVLMQNFKENSSFKDHSYGFKMLNKNLKVGIVSMDMTAWTDLLPATLQKLVVEHLFGANYANAWYELVVKCGWNVKDIEGAVYYGTGQGMGTKGSFAIASLTDHLIVEWLLHNLYPDICQNSEISTLYNKVGDDLWVYDPEFKIKDAYEKLLKMKINLSKSKVATSENLVGEFTSQNINFGQIESRISVKLCLNIRNNLHDLPTLIHHLSSRNGLDVANLVKALYKSGRFPDSVWLTFIQASNLESYLEAKNDTFMQLREGLKKAFLEIDFSLKDKIIDFGNFENSSTVILALRFKQLLSTLEKTQAQAMKIYNIDQKTLETWETSFQTEEPLSVWESKLPLERLIPFVMFNKAGESYENINMDLVMRQLKDIKTPLEALKTIAFHTERLESIFRELDFVDEKYISQSKVQKNIVSRTSRLINKLTITVEETGLHILFKDVPPIRILNRDTSAEFPKWIIDLDRALYLMHDTTKYPDPLRDEPGDNKGYPLGLFKVGSLLNNLTIIE